MTACPACGHPLVLLSATDAPAATPEPDAARQTLRTYLATVRVTDVHGAAAHLFGVDYPARPLLERARRMLEQLVADGTVTKAPGRSGGRSGGVPTLYRVAG